MNDTRDFLGMIKFLMPGSMHNLSQAIALRHQLATEEKQWHQVTALESLQRMVDETYVGRYDGRPEVRALVPRPLPEVAHTDLNPMVSNYGRLEREERVREMRNVSSHARLEQKISNWEHEPFPNRKQA